MATCRRCGQAVEPNTVHIFWGGEERRLAIQATLGYRVSLCGQPLSQQELREQQGYYILDEEGNLQFKDSLGSQP